MNDTLRPTGADGPSQRGFSLIELLIAVAIPLVSTLLIFQTVANGDKTRRTTVSSNDALRSGSLAMDQLAWMARNAGSGVAQVPGAYNCLLNAWVGGTQRLPMATALAAPFDVLPTNLRLAPLLAIDGGASPDVLVMTIGSSPSANIAMPRGQVADGNNDTLGTTNVVGLFNGDALLMTRYLVDGDFVSSSADCFLTQVPSTAAVDAATGYLSNNPFSIQGATLSAPQKTLPTARYSLASLGRAPMLVAVGVRTSGGRSDLVMVDLLAAGTPVVTVIAENVVDFQVLYGVDTTVSATANIALDADFFGDGVVDGWVAPTGDWALAGMTSLVRAGTVSLTGAERQRRIKAVKLALITTDAFVEKDDVSRASTAIKLFEGAGSSLTLTRTIGTTAGYSTKQRYRDFETTVAVRNLTSSLSPVGQDMIYAAP